jgi:hypothetical protein
MSNRFVPDLKGRYKEALAFSGYLHQFYRVISIMITFNCPIQCKHCYLRCGPSRRENLDFSGLRRWFGEAKSSGELKGIIISGGEPFVDMRRLETLVAWAEEIDLPAAVLSSGFWGKTLDDSRKILKRLPGLTGLALSVDRFHQEFVPLEYLKNIVTAATELELPICIFNCASKDDEDPIVSELNASLGQELSPFMIVFENPLHDLGRAEKKTGENDLVPVTDLPDFRCGNIDSVPVLLPSGEVVACCGEAFWSPSYVGGLEVGWVPRDSFVEIRERVSRNPLMQTLRVLGPKDLAIMVEKMGLGHLLRGRYKRDDICDLCSDLFSHREIVDLLVEETRSLSHRRKIDWSRAFNLGELEVFDGRP